MPDERSERHEAADACIGKHALLAGAAGLVPAPWVDVAGVGAVQVNMILELARTYGVSINVSIAKQLIGTMAGAQLTQKVFQWVASGLKAIPGPGTVVGEVLQGVISVTLTYAMGKAAKLFFESEQRLTVEQLQRAYSENLKEGRSFAEDHASSLAKVATSDEFTKDLEAIRAGLAKNLGKDAEFVAAVGRVFSQFRQRLDEEADVDADLKDLVRKAKSRDQ